MVGRAALMSGCAGLLATMALANAAQAAPDQTPGPSQASPASSQTAATNVGSVTVAAREKPEVVRRKVNTFVKDITRQSQFEENVPRWRTPICPLVVGFTAPQSQYLFTRLQQVATAAGAPMAPAKCDTNLMIVATDHPDELLAGLVKSASGVFGGEGPTAINTFVRTRRPVRVWYDATLVGPDNDAVSSTMPPVAGPSAGAIPQGGPVIKTYGGSSRLRSVASHGLVFTYVIVDGNHLKDVSIGAVSDYVSMVSLAQVDLDANYSGASTILRLYSAPAADAPTGLTDWDQAFLHALYHSDPYSKLQRAEVSADASEDVTTARKPGQ